MNRYKAFDFRASILAVVATVFLSTGSLLFAAGPISPVIAAPLSQSALAAPLA